MANYLTKPIKNRGVKRISKLMKIHLRARNQSKSDDKTLQKSALNRVIREENPNKSLKHIKKQRKSRHTETSNKV